MAFVETIPEDDASGDVAEIYETMREQFGYLPNLVRVSRCDRRPTRPGCS